MSSPPETQRGPAANRATTYSDDTDSVTPGTDRRRYVRVAIDRGPGWALYAWLCES